jgi:hypothetical protein
MQHPGREHHTTVRVAARDCRRLAGTSTTQCRPSHGTH